MNRFAIFLTVLSLIALVFDFYFYFGVKSTFRSEKYSNYFRYGYWGVSIIYYVLLIYTLIKMFGGFEMGKVERTLGQMLYFSIFVPKILGSSFLIIDDVIRLFRWLFSLVMPSSADQLDNSEKGISRLRFLQLSALGTFGVLLSSMSYGVIRGAYNYTVRKQKIKIKDLPEEFEGLRFGQISDLHVGSFMSNAPMEEAVELINEQNLDMLFFTGDLVNDKAEEALDFIETFKKIKPKVYSVLGNHDYPEYVYDRDDHQARAHNFNLMLDIHKKMDFELLLDENRILEKNGKKLAIIGIQNWGRSFSKYGDLQKAYKGAEDADVKLLLSHDPSHWDLQVRPEFSDIDVTFSGHTHGMQFGLEAFGIKFSPVQWAYKQWAGLYGDQKQQLYVNRGLGFVGYPGRVGISPEITVFELVKA